MQNNYLRITLFALGIILGTVLILFTAVELTSQPKFCSSCHFMRPYVDAWKLSTHADVTCTKCHFPPGIKSTLKGKITAASMVVNYFTGVYKKSKPWAEISDESCLRSGCHEERLLKDKVKFKEGIIFGHKPHLTQLRRGKKLRCTSCHSQVVQGEHISVTESTCFLCHFKNTPDVASINKCTFCHEAPVQTDSSTVKYDHTFVLDSDISCLKCHGPMQVGDGSVPRERCSSCHAELGKIEQYDNVDLVHKNHVTDHKVECQNCHTSILHKSVSKTADIVPECQSCHSKSHEVQYELFSGQIGKGIKPHPDPMFEAGLNCQACHIFHENISGLKNGEETVVAKGESCETCHGKGYAKLFQQWKTVMAEKVKSVESSLKVVKKELAKAKTNAETDDETDRLLDIATNNFLAVKKGNIVHNVAYSDELLASSSTSLREILKLINSRASINDISVFSKLVPSECRNCHYGQDENVVTAFGIDFSHNIHVVTNELPCSKCHSNKRTHGETIVKRSDCLSCHHTQKIVPCETCHDVQASIFSGTIDFGFEAEPDIMSDEGVVCSDCHFDENEHVRKADGESCINCHDDEYPETLASWQKDTRASVSKIESILAGIDDNNFAGKSPEEIHQMREIIQKIKSDRSWGAHNIDLVTEVLEDIDRSITPKKP